jgi:hypothetical protein
VRQFEPISWDRHRSSAASKEPVINSRRITQRRGLAAAGVVALVAAGSAACGTAQAGATPQDKVTGAFVKLGDQKSLTLGASIAASADQIYTAMKNEDDFTRGDATTFAALHAKVSLSADKPLSKLGDGDTSSFGFQLSSDAAGTQNLAEIRSVDKTLYLRVDLNALEKLDPSASGGDSGLNDLVGSLDQLPDSAGALKAAVDGKWISIDADALTSLAKTFGGDSGTTGSTSSLDPQSAKKLVTGLENSLTHNAKFTDLGSSGGADHIQVSVAAKQFASELKTSLSSVTSGVPGFSADDLDALDDVPNRTVTADVAIKDGSVSGLTFDLAQLNDKPAAGKVPLALTLDGGTAPVSAPAGAQKFDPTELLSLVAGSLPDGLMGSPDTDTGSGTATPGSGDDTTVTGFGFTPVPS